MERKYLYGLALLAGLLFAGTKVWAVEDEDAPAAVSVSDIEALSNRINDLAKFAHVNVLLQLQYVNAGSNGVQPKGLSSPIKSSSQTGTYNDLFLGKRAEISVAGDLVDKKISYRVQGDPLATTTAKPGVSNGEQLKDYWIRFSYVPYAELQFGQQRYAQSLEARTASGELDYANRALVVTALEDRRDVAFQVAGSKVPVGSLSAEYALAVVQGAGQNSGLDNSEFKDWAGRIGLTFSDSDLSVFLGASGYLGNEAYPGAQVPSAGVTVPAAVFANNFARSNAALEGRINIGGLKLQGEFVAGQLEPGNNYNPWDGTTLAKALVSDPQGWYASAQYRWEDWRLGLRAESYDPDNTPGSKFNINNDVLTLGIDWFQGKDKFKLSLNAEEHFQQYEALITQLQVNL